MKSFNPTPLSRPTRIQDASLGTVVGCSVSMNCAMSVGWNVLGFYEELGTRLTWSNLFKNPTFAIDYNMVSGC